MQKSAATTRIPVVLIGIALLFRIGTFLLWPVILAAIIALSIVLGKIMIEAGSFHLALVIVPVIATGVCVYGAILTMREVSGFAFAVRTQRDSFPTLWSFVAEVAESVGGRVPDNIIIGMEPNFYVTQSPILLTPADEVRGRTLYMSAPLLRVMDEVEVKAVLAHEFSHFTGSDTLYSSHVAPAYHSLHQGTSAMKVNMESSIFLLVGFAVPLAVLWMYQLGFKIIDRALSRSRELRCDEIASQAYGQSHMAAALVKVVGYGTPLLYVNVHFANLIQEGQTFENYPAWFGLNREHWGARINQVVAQAATSKTKAFDTHPALQARLAALAITPNEAAQLASAESSFAESYDISAVERLLTNEYSRFVYSMVSEMSQAEAG